MKKVLPALLVSSALVFNSSLVALAVPTEGPVLRSLPIETPADTIYKLLPKLMELRYPMYNVAYNCHHAVGTQGYTIYFMDVTINGRLLVGQSLNLTLYPDGHATTTGISAEKLFELCDLGSSYWDDLSQVSEDDEIYAVRHNLYYTENVYVEESNVKKIASCIAYVNNEYIPCTKYNLYDANSGDTYEYVISSIDRAIISGPSIVRK